MREALDDEGAAERPELIAPPRRLIHSVVVHAEPGVKGFEVEIKGRLQELIGAPFLTRCMGGVSERPLPLFPTRRKYAIFPSIVRLNSEAYRMVGSAVGSVASSNP